MSKRMREGDSSEKQRICGVMRAVIIDLKDPKDQGRVGITVPAIAGGSATLWADIVSFGKNRKGKDSAGLEVGDEVVVAFVGGDTDYPIMLGILQNPI